MYWSLCRCWGCNGNKNRHAATQLAAQWKEKREVSIHINYNSSNQKILYKFKSVYIYEK